MPGLEQVLLLCLAAAFAGWVDAVSGGGGLVQLPALLLVLPGASPAAPTRATVAIGRAVRRSGRTRRW